MDKKQTPVDLDFEELNRDFAERRKQELDACGFGSETLRLAREKRDNERLRRFQEAPRVYAIYLFDKKAFKKFPYLFLEKAAFTNLVTKFYPRACSAILTNRNGMSENGSYPIVVLQAIMLDVSDDIYQDDGEVYIWSKKQKKYYQVGVLRHSFTSLDPKPWATLEFFDERFSKSKVDVFDVFCEMSKGPLKEKS